MIQEDGTSTIKPILNGSQHPIGVFDEHSKISILLDDGQYCAKTGVEIRMKGAAFGFVIDVDKVGTLRDCLSHMLDVLSTPAAD